MKKNKNKKKIELGEGLDVVLKRQSSHSELGSVYFGTTELLLGDLLLGDGLDNIRTSHKHVGGILDHESEVSEGRRVHGTTNTGAHDHRELRDHSRGVDIALESIPS